MDGRGRLEVGQICPVVSLYLICKEILNPARRYYTAHVQLILQILYCSSRIWARQSTITGRLMNTEDIIMT